MRLLHTTRLFRPLLHPAVLRSPRLLRPASHTAIRVLTDDDYVPFVFAHSSALGMTERVQSGWPPPPAVVPEPEIEVVGGGSDAADVVAAMERRVGGGKMRVGGQRPTVAARKEKKRLEREAAAAEAAQRKSGKYAKKYGEKGFRKKAWDPKFMASGTSGTSGNSVGPGKRHGKKMEPWLEEWEEDLGFNSAFEETQDASTVGLDAPKTYKKREYSKKVRDAEYKRASSELQDTAAATSAAAPPDTPSPKTRGCRSVKNRKAWFLKLLEYKRTTEPGQRDRGNRSAPTTTTSTHTKTNLGLQRQRALASANPTAPRHSRTRRGLRSTSSSRRDPRTSVPRDRKPRDPNKKPNKWTLPEIEPVAVEPTRLQKHIASHPRGEIERWKIEKARLQSKFRGAHWSPLKKLSPEALDGIRVLHRDHPEYTTEKLSQLFEVSPDAIRRILKSKWRPDAAVREDRMVRWENRGSSVWDRWLGMGVVHTKKMKKERTSRRVARERRWGVVAEKKEGEETTAGGRRRRDNVARSVADLSARIV